MTQKAKTNQQHCVEMMDRVHCIREHVDCVLTSHPLVDVDTHYEVLLHHVQSSLGELYQYAGNQAWKYQAKIDAKKAKKTKKAKKANKVLKSIG